LGDGTPPTAAQLHSHARSYYSPERSRHYDTAVAEVAALGLAANIITFIDFGFRVVSQARNVRDSFHGTTAEARELDLILQDVEKLNEAVLNHQNTRKKLTQDEERLLEMARECKKLATQLRESLNPLKMRDGRSKSMESMRVVISSFLHERSIMSLQKRPETLETRVRSNLASALQGYVPISGWFFELSSLALVEKRPQRSYHQTAGRHPARVCPI
jgi:hypothetical protein